MRNPQNKTKFSPSIHNRELHIFQYTGTSITRDRLCRKLFKIVSFLNLSQAQGHTFSMLGTLIKVGGM